MATADRILVLGAGGMCGHATAIAAFDRSDTWATVRRVVPPRLAKHAGRIVTGVDVLDPDSLDEALRRAQPSIVINCIGIVKQRHDIDPTTLREINTVLPHHLARRCGDIGARLVHVSTDCVFSGSPGDRPHGYSESDIADPEDEYGRSKLAGEIDAAPHVTIRTSMIGPELDRASGLFEWFLAAPGPIYGFTNAWFTGLATPTLAELILDIAATTSVTGLFHVPAPRITKNDLLRLLRDHLRPDLDIIPTAEPRIDRCLDGRRLATTLNLITPSWEEMVDLLARLHHKDTR